MFMYVSMIRLLDGSSKAHLLHAIQSQMYYDKFSFVDVNYTKYTVTNVHNTNFSIIHTLNICNGQTHASYFVMKNMYIKTSVP